MEDLVIRERSFWRGRSVMITGHTGFKGGWLSLWLHYLGAKVHGYALGPPTKPSFFKVAHIEAVLASHTRADLGDFARLRAFLRKAQPSVVFHLAAQPLVRESYREPLATFASNIMGTANLLEAVRATESVGAVVLVTSDKVYQNREWEYPYREVDELGGHDPYSASKAAAEIVASSYRVSFFGGISGHIAKLATARAGNVVGGGDWAAERLVPDCLKAFEASESVKLRYPNAVRPWQHVLDPIAGYLKLAEALLGKDGGAFARAWNFGPDASNDVPVGNIAEGIARLWGEGARVERTSSRRHPHEAGLLHLDSTLARNLLGWRPRWAVKVALEQTVAWHRAWIQDADMTTTSINQIRAYSKE